MGIPQHTDDPIKAVARLHQSAKQKRCEAAVQNNRGRRLGNGDVYQLDLDTPDVNNKNPAYPQVFALLPIFRPLRQRKDGNAYTTTAIHDLPNYRIERRGPGLSTTEEDVILAILHLCRQRELHGPSKHFPAPVMDPEERMDRVAYEGDLSAYEINKYLGRDVGGSDLQATREMIDRLAQTKLRLMSKKGGAKNKGRFVDMHFLDISGDNDKSGRLRIQIHPLVVELMLQSYSFINLNVRNKLSDVGKCLQRVVSARTYSKNPVLGIGLAELQVQTGYGGSTADFKRAIIAQCEKMKQLGFCAEWNITGTGRKEPFKLYFRRNIKEAVID